MKQHLPINKFGLILKLGLTAGLFSYILSGCALFQSPCGFDCEAKYVCNGLNELFYEDKDSFEIAKLASNSELARFHCVWREGLILPGDKDTWGRKPTHTEEKTKNKQAANTKYNN